MKEKFCYLEVWWLCILSNPTTCSLSQLPTSETVGRHKWTDGVFVTPSGSGQWILVNWQVSTKNYSKADN